MSIVEVIFDKLHENKLTFRLYRTTASCSSLRTVVPGGHGTTNRVAPKHTVTFMIVDLIFVDLFFFLPQKFVHYSFDALEQSQIKIIKTERHTLFTTAHQRYSWFRRWNHFRNGECCYCCGFFTPGAHPTTSNSGPAQYVLTFRTPALLLTVFVILLFRDRYHNNLQPFSSRWGQTESVCVFFSCFVRVLSAKCSFFAAVWCLNLFFFQQQLVFQKKDFQLRAIN